MLMQKWGKNMKNMNFRRIISTLCGIISVGILFFAAIRFPKYYCAYTDKKTLHNMVTTDIQIQTYKTAYTTFPEKIHALALAKDSGAVLRAVKMNGTTVNPERKGMTKVVRTEFKKMYDSAIIPKAYKPKAKNMTTFERYVIYAANEPDGMQGISCWKLEYESKKRTFTIYLDEEYHKIYQLNIWDKETASEQTNAVVGVSSKSRQITPEYIYLWWDGIIRYYDLDTYQEFSDSGLEKYSVYDTVNRGFFLFKDIQEPIEIYHIADSTSLSMGILLTEMIQF